MKVLSNIAEIKKEITAQKNNGASVALVPTMGNLHDGHLSLVKKAKQDGNFVVVSIFVNPIQFGPNEDYNNYPRTLDADMEKIKQYCDVVFAPEVQDMYADGSNIMVTETQKSTRLCGQFRTGHFDGVLTVVLKLFNICMPTTAYFGLKDHQQYVLIKDMVKKLDLNINIVGCPLIREVDGLAMSSRNSYMNPEQRKKALALSESLRTVKELFDSGVRTVDDLKGSALQVLLPRVKVQYFEIIDAESLETVKTACKGNVIAVATFCDNVRLIDNMVL